jgi:site-specific recombinase
MKSKTKIRLTYAAIAVPVIACYYLLGFASVGKISWGEFVNGTIVLVVMGVVIALFALGLNYAMKKIEQWKREI